MALLLSPQLERITWLSTSLSEACVSFNPEFEVSYRLSYHSAYNISDHTDMISCGKLTDTSDLRRYGDKIYGTLSSETRKKLSDQKAQGKFTYTDIPVTADSPFCSLVKKYTTVPGAEPSIPKPLRTRQSSLDGPSDSEEREEPSSSVTDSYTSRPDARPTEEKLNSWRSQLYYD